MLERDRLHEGLSDREAAYAARRPLGNQAAISEATRDMWSFAWMDDLTQDVRYALRGIALPAPQTKPLERVLSASTDPPRFVMFLMSTFAVLALALAAVGIYGILNYAVSQRRREFAIRLALGAQPGGVLREVVREGLGLALLGCLAGAAGAAAAGLVLGNFLYQVKPWDVATLSVVLGVVLVVALAACLAPGWRASAEDPAMALRAD
jgi:ABC-type antimicrobial peptide transport system permease subunit